MRRVASVGWFGRASVISLVWNGSLLASLEGGVTLVQEVESSIPRNNFFWLGCEGEDYGEFFALCGRGLRRRVGRSVPFGRWAWSVAGLWVARVASVGWFGRPVPGEERLERRKGWPHLAVPSRQAAGCRFLSVGGFGRSLGCGSRVLLRLDGWARVGNFAGLARVFSGVMGRRCDLR